MNEGWIKLHRKIANNKLWLAEPFTRGQAWVDLLLLANHSPGFLRVRGLRVEVARGQVGWSQQKLAERWKWSQGKVFRFLKELEKNEHQIEQQKNNISLIITICNYDMYQKNGEQNGEQTESRRRADGEQTETNKNDKNDKNDKNKDLKDFVDKVRPPSPRKSFSIPSLEEIINYCQERKNSVDPEKFHDYYQSNGWRVGKNPMKDWKAAIRTWEKSNLAVKEISHGKIKSGFVDPKPGPGTDWLS